MAGFDENKGANRLANVLSTRMKKEIGDSLVLDFGEVQANGNLVTNTFPVPVPKGEYSVCRQLTLGSSGERFTSTDDSHGVLLPEKMRGLAPGDRVLVAWVNSEAVVIDIILNS